MAFWREKLFIEFGSCYRISHNPHPQDKKLRISLNANRKVVGTLRGYDAFLNVVLEDVESEDGQYLGQIVVRGNSIVQLEGLERV